MRTMVEHALHLDVNKIIPDCFPDEMSILPYIDLGGDVLLPRVGIGTYLSRGDEVKTSVKAALDLGLRHIDTASIYRNEEEISQVIQSYPRAELFLTSKISPHEQGRENATQACEGILRRLGVDYIDLLLIHWPGASKVSPSSPINSALRKETWQVLEKQVQCGKSKAIGVSNYEVHHLEDLLSYASIRPAVNQIEIHPHHPSTHLLEWCRGQGIQVIAYSPLGAGRLLKNDTVVHLAKKYQITPSQVLLRWGLQHACAVIPKSSKPERIQEFDPKVLLSDSLHLHNTDMNMLDTLSLEEGENKYCWDPSVVC